jgi:hypothetical protein
VGRFPFVGVLPSQVLPPQLPCSLSSPLRFSNSPLFSFHRKSPSKGGLRAVESPRRNDIRVMAPPYIAQVAFARWTVKAKLARRLKRSGLRPRRGLCVCLRHPHLRTFVGNGIGRHLRKSQQIRTLRCIRTMLSSDFATALSRTSSKPASTDDKIVAFEGVQSQRSPPTTFRTPPYKTLQRRRLHPHSRPATLRFPRLTYIFHCLR